MDNMQQIKATLIIVCQKKICFDDLIIIRINF